MKKYIALFTLFLGLLASPNDTAAVSAPVGWQYVPDVGLVRLPAPAASATVQAANYQATSLATSSFPIASSTIFCLGTDCRIAWPATVSGGGLASSSPAWVIGQLAYVTGAGTVAGTSSPVVGYITATSTGTSTFAGKMVVGSTNEYFNKFTLQGASDDYPTLEVKSGTNVFRILVNGIGDDLAGLGTFSSGDDLILFSSSTGRIRIKGDGEVAMTSNNLSFPSGGDGDSKFTFSQTEDGFLSVQRSGGVDDNHSILMLQAPEDNPTEATMTLMRNYGNNNLEYVDMFNQRYVGVEALTGVVVAKKGTGELLPYTLRFYNADLGNISQNATWGFVVLPNGQMGLAVSTTTVTNGGASLLVGSTTVPVKFKGGLEVDGTTRIATSTNGVLSATNGVIGTTSTSSLGLGDVRKVGTPANNQVGVWTGDGTLEGDAGFVYDAASSTVAVDDLSIIAVSGGGQIRGSAGGAFNVTDQVYTGAQEVGGNILPEISNIRNLGSAIRYWNEVYARNASTSNITVASTTLLAGTTTATGYVNLASSTVRQVVYPSFTWPGFATTTSGTTTLPLGGAIVSQLWNSSLCKATSGTINFAFKDDAGNLMNAQTASSTYGALNLTTNNSFVAGEGRNVDIGPVTNAQLTCSVSVLVNN